MTDKAARQQLLYPGPFRSRTVDLCRDVELQRKPALPVTVSYSEGGVRELFFGVPQKGDLPTAAIAAGTGPAPAGLLLIRSAFGVVLWLVSGEITTR